MSYAPIRLHLKKKIKPVRDFLFDVHFVDLENFQPLARFKVQKFAEVTKFVLGFKCDSCAPDRTYAFPRCQAERLNLPSDYLSSIIPSLAHPGAGECFYQEPMNGL